MNTKRIGHAWFNGRSTIGVVLAYDTVTEELKSWISSAYGNDEETDIQLIEDYGTKFPSDLALEIIKRQGTVDVPREIWDSILKKFDKN